MRAKFQKLSYMYFKGPWKIVSTLCTAYLCLLLTVAPMSESSWNMGNNQVEKVGCGGRERRVKEGRKERSGKQFPDPPFRKGRPGPPVSSQATGVMFWDTEERLPWRGDLTSGQEQKEKGCYTWTHLAWEVQRAATPGLRNTKAQVALLPLWSDSWEGNGGGGNSLTQDSRLPVTLKHCWLSLPPTHSSPTRLMATSEIYTVITWLHSFPCWKETEHPGRINEFPQVGG